MFNVVKVYEEHSRNPIIVNNKKRTEESGKCPVAIKILEQLKGYRTVRTYLPGDDPYAGSVTLLLRGAWLCGHHARKRASPHPLCSCVPTPLTPTLEHNRMK